MPRKKLPAGKTKKDLASENCLYEKFSEKFFVCQHGHRVGIMNEEREGKIVAELTRLGMYKGGTDGK